MRIVGAPTRSLLLGLLVTAAPLTGCAETMGADKIAMERDQARLAAAQRDQWIRALEWQLAAQRSDAEVTRQRSEGFLRELWTRTLELAAQNLAIHASRAGRRLISGRSRWSDVVPGGSRRRGERYG